MLIASVGMVATTTATPMVRPTTIAGRATPATTREMAAVMAETVVAMMGRNSFAVLAVK